MKWKSWLTLIFVSNVYRGHCLSIIIRAHMSVHKSTRSRGQQLVYAGTGGCCCCWWWWWCCCCRIAFCSVGRALQTNRTRAAAAAAAAVTKAARLPLPPPPPPLFAYVPSSSTRHGRGHTSALTLALTFRHARVRTHSHMPSTLPSRSHTDCRSHAHTRLPVPTSCPVHRLPSPDCPARNYGAGGNENPERLSAHRHPLHSASVSKNAVRRRTERQQRPQSRPDAALKNGFLRRIVLLILQPAVTWMQI